MNTVWGRASDIVDRLTAAGIRATLDPRNLTPPGVLVRPPTITYDLAYGHTVEWTVTAYVPGPYNGDALAALIGPGALVSAIDAALDCVTAARPGPDPETPSYELSWTEGV